MRRGTTPTQVFHIAIDLTRADCIYITYKQDGKIILEKDQTDITVGDRQLTVTLSQKDTLSFYPGMVTMQIRARVGDVSYASNYMTTKINDILKDGEI